MTTTTPTFPDIETWTRPRLLQSRGERSTSSAGRQSCTHCFASRSSTESEGGCPAGSTDNLYSKRTKEGGHRARHQIHRQFSQKGKSTVSLCAITIQANILASILLNPRQQTLLKYHNSNVIHPSEKTVSDQAEDSFENEVKKSIINEVIDMWNEDENSTNLKLISKVVF